MATARFLLCIRELAFPKRNNPNMSWMSICGLCICRHKWKERQMSNPNLLSMRRDLKEWNAIFSRCSRTLTFLCANTRFGSVVVYVFDVKDFLLRKISISSFLVRSVMVAAFLGASCIGWSLGESFFQNMCGVPAFLCSSIFGNMSDRLIKQFCFIFFCKCK